MNAKTSSPGLGRGIPNLSQILRESRQKLDDRVERLQLSFKNLLSNKHNQIERISLRPYYIKNIIDKQSESLKNLTLRMGSVSIDSVLARGFAWIKNAKGRTVYNLEQAKQSPTLEINFIDGKIKPNPQERKMTYKAICSIIFSTLLFSSHTAQALTLCGKPAQGEILSAYAPEQSKPN